MLPTSQTHAHVGGAQTTQLSMTRPSRDNVVELREREWRTVSSAQRRLWVLDRLGAGAAYNLSAWFVSAQPFDLQTLRQAVVDLVRRHEPLRTTFVMRDGELRGVLREADDSCLEVEWLRGLAGDAAERRADCIVREVSARPFDLAAAPPVRFVLVRAETVDRLVFVGHHATVDGPSIPLLLDELLAAYEARRSGVDVPFEPLGTTYRDYVDWEAHQRATTPHLAYWKERLRGSPEMLDLPLDRPRPLQPDYAGASHEFSFGSELSQRLRGLRESQRVSSFMLVLALYQTLLARYTDQSTVLVGTPVSHRHTPAFQPLVGMLANTLPVRADIPVAITVGELLRQVRQSVLEAMEHASTPFEDIVDALKPGRTGAYMPYLQTAFVMETSSGPSRYHVESDAAFWDLTLFVWEDADRTLRGVWRYATAVFEASTVERFADHLVALAKGFAVGPQVRVHGVPLVTREEAATLSSWGGERGAVDERRIEAIFEACVRRSPDASAVVWGSDHLSYAELDARATAVARAIAPYGVEGRRVGVHASRSVAFVVAVLGILKARAAYVPFDPGHPADRLTFTARDADVALVLSERPEADVAWGAPVLDLRGHGVEQLGAAAPAPTAAPRVLDGRAEMGSSLRSTRAETAYVMYTSGSTGHPKGVPAPHAGVVRLVFDSDYVRFEPGDIVAMASNPAFDASTFEIWGALLNGARLVGIDRETLLSPERLQRTIREQRITVMFLTTSLFHQLAAVAPGMFRSLRYLVVGGEAVNPTWVRAVRQAGAPTHLINGYGPTENTTFSTAYDMTRADPQLARMPIGRPIAGSSCVVLDRVGGLAPIGARGELYVGGAGLSTGYLNREELTAERFVRHPFRHGARLYRTGDAVRWRSDGLLDFLGRLDRQVKIRGHRIEPGEIEHALAEIDGVAQCAVVAREGASEAQLVAYWVPREAAAPTSETIRGQLMRRLPDYMIPVAFVRLDRLPLTSNGKLDIDALPAVVPEDGAAPSEDETPRTATERMVAEHWAAVLGVSRVGRHDDFFVLGGSSLLALRAAALIESASGVPVAIGDIFAHPTVAAFASALGKGSDVEPLVREIRRGGSNPPLYWPPGLLGDSAGCDEILARIPPDQPVLTLRAPPPTAEAPSLVAMSRTLCDAVEQRHPTGPICLAGYSFAGLLAYQMAIELTERGRDVAFLAVLDAWPDDTPPRTWSERLAALRTMVSNAPLWVHEHIYRTFDRRTPRRLTQMFLSHVKDSIGLLKGTPRVDWKPEEIFEGHTLTNRMRETITRYIAAVATARFEPYPGRLVLFRSRVRPLVRPQPRDLGWANLVQGIEIIDIPGGHNTLMNPPHSLILAEKFVARLQETARQAAARKGSRADA